MTVLIMALGLTACRPFLAEPNNPKEPVEDVDSDTDTDTDTDTVDTDTSETDTDQPVSYQFPQMAHDGDAPWGMVIDILSVDGGSGPGGNLKVGDTPSVTFTVMDNAGVPYHPTELSDIDFHLTGPSTHMSLLYWFPTMGTALDEVEPVPAQVDGDAIIAWKYTFPGPIPAKYLPPPNDTADIGLDVGDWGGEDVVSGTYSLAVWGYVRHILDGGSEVVGASDTEWVVLGNTGTLDIRERVLTSNCADCHGEPIVAHGGTRTGDVNLCISCHIQGSEDRWSQQDAATTPGVTVFMPIMIHRIHRGAGLAITYQVNGYPAVPFLPGYPDYNTHTYDTGRFPSFPEGVGGCFNCHEGAAQGATIQAYATRNACGACHDDINWATGENHEINSVWTPQNDDASCLNSGCHPPSVIVANHQDPRRDPAINPGLNLTIVDVTGGTGSGSQFVPGDTVSVEFTITDDSGSLVDIAALDSFAFRLAGPVEHFQLTVSTSDVITASTPDLANGTWTYNATAVIPTVYPAQLNDTPDLGLADGDWQGQPLVEGTYRVALETIREVFDNDSVGHMVPATATMDVLLGSSATSLVAHQPVTQERCESCHRTLWVHGERRTNTDGCPTCHTAGAEDKNSDRDNLTTQGVTIDFKVLIHKLHEGSGLSQTYDVNGFGFPPPFGYTTHNYNDVVFPWFDGGTAHCEKCHGQEYKTASGTVCASCHDTPLAAAHIAANTDANLGESCDVCHGEGRSASVSAVHHRNHEAN